MLAIADAEAYHWTSSRSLVWYVAITNATAWVDGTTRHLYGSRDIPHTSRPSTSRYIEDRMEIGAIGAASMQVDARNIGGIAALGSFDFEVVDSGDWYQSLVDLATYYDGRPVSLFIAYESTLAGATDLCVWSGIIREVERNPIAETLLFRCETSDARYSKECPPKTWGTTDGTDPSGAKGRPRQLVFGAHTMIPTFMMGPATDTTGVEIAGNHGPSYAFADAALSVGLRTFVSAVFGDEGLIQATGGTATILSAVSGLLSQGRVVMPYQASGKLGIRFDVPLTSYQKGGHYEMSGMIWDPILDDNDATYIYVNHKNGTFYAAIYLFPIWTVAAKLPYITTSGTIQKVAAAPTFPKIYLGYRALFTATPSATMWPMSASISFWRDRDEPITGSGNYYYPFAFPARPFTDHAEDASYAAEAVYFNAKSAPTGSGVDIPLETLSDLSGGLIGIQVSWDYQSDFGSPDVMNMKVCEMRGIRVYADVEYPTDAGVFVSAEGYKDTATSADWLTGTAGALIENPAYVAAWLARYVSGAGVAKTPRASFSTVAAKRLAWRFASVVGERSTTDDVIQKVAETAAFHVWCDAAGNYRAFTTDRQTRATITLNPGDLVGGALKSAKQTPIADVATSFLFLYSLNTITGNYDKSLALSDAALPAGMASDMSTVCAAAKTRYTAGVDVPITFENDWIRDNATALLWAEKTARWRAGRRWMLQFVVDALLVTLEPGDAIEFATAEWLAVPAAVLGKQYIVTGVEISPASNTVTVSAVEAI